MTPVDAYLRALSDHLWLREARRRRVLAELRGHLVDLERHDGPFASIDAVAARFGSVASVADGINSAVTSGDVATPAGGEPRSGILSWVLVVGGTVVVLEYHQLLVALVVAHLAGAVAAYRLVSIGAPPAAVRRACATQMWLPLLLIAVAAVGRTPWSGFAREVVATWWPFVTAAASALLVGTLAERLPRPRRLRRISLAALAVGITSLLPLVMLVRGNAALGEVYAIVALVSVWTMLVHAFGARCAGRSIVNDHGRHRADLGRHRRQLTRR